MKQAIWLAAAAIAFAGAARADTVLFDDNFDADDLGSTYYQTIDASDNGTSDGLTNWNVTAGNIDRLGSGVVGCTCIDLDGTSSSVPAIMETIQAFNFIAGLSYQLAIEFESGTGADGFLITFHDFGFGVGGYSFPLVASITAPVADSGASKITLTMLSTPDNYGPYLSRVTLTELGDRPNPSAVPLPAGLPLLAAGLGGLALLRRRRRNG